MIRGVLLTLVVVGALLAGIAPTFVDPASGGPTSPAFKIFFFHVPAAWCAMFLSLPISAFGAAALLATGDARWDRLSQAAAEVGLVWATGVLISGPLWAKPAWGTYWTWEPRLTTFLILFLTYLAYPLFRASMEDPLLRGRRAAVYNLVAVLTIPFCYYSIKVWGRLSHPEPGPDFFGDPRIAKTLTFNLVAFTALTFHFIYRRMSILSREAVSA